MPFTLALEQAEFSVFPLNCQGIGELREDKNWKATETLPARAAQLVLELSHLLFQCPNLYFQTGQERLQKGILPSLIPPSPLTVLKETPYWMKFQNFISKFLDQVNDLTCFQHTSPNTIKELVSISQERVPSN